MIYIRAQAFSSKPLLHQHRLPCRRVQLVVGKPKARVTAHGDRIAAEYFQCELAAATHACQIVRRAQQSLAHARTPEIGVDHDVVDIEQRAGLEG